MSSSSDGGSLAQAALTISVSPGDAGSTCNLTSASTWSLGGGVNGTPVRNGESEQGDLVSVGCGVRTAGGGAFQVVATIEKKGVGVLTLQGNIQSGGPSPVSANFVLEGGLGAWVQYDCTLTFPATVPDPLEAGRIWAIVECRSATAADPSIVCDAHAELRLENCNPQ